MRGKKHSASRFRRHGLPSLGQHVGQWFTAAAPSNVDLYRDTTGRYQMFNGTSAATPYVAGVVALMLQKDPDLTLGQIRDLLHDKAAKDDETGQTPNPQWGYGKLNKKVVGDILDAIPTARGNKK